MKANEFVKKFGYKHNAANLKYLPLNQHAELERLVESHELVESLSGINTMRIMQKQMILNSLKGGMNISFDGEFVGTFSYDQLEQAISDVESCQ